MDTNDFKPQKIFHWIYSSTCMGSFSAASPSIGLLLLWMDGGWIEKED